MNTPSLRALLLAVALGLPITLGLAPLAHAAGIIDLSWNACSPIVVDRSMSADGANHLYVSVLGQDEAHRGYQWFVVIHDASGSVPDAWRFDDGGCQPPGRVAIEHLWPDMTQSCPAFQGGLASTQTRGYQSVALGVPGLPMVAFLTNSYPEGQSSVDPAKRYALGRIVFDHSSSVPGAATTPGTCGGLDEPMCLALEPTLTGWVDMDGTSRAWTIGNGAVTVRGGCEPVPVAPTTWGTIKAQYRR